MTRPTLFSVIPLIVATSAGLLGARPLFANDLNDRSHKPNIVFILADDLGYGELGCYGQKVIQTPYLDRMAAEGVRFTQFYAGSTVCAPSRSVLMTGKHAGRTRVRGNAGRDNPEAQMLRDEDVTVAEILQQAGYATGLIGKWGLGMPGDEGVPNRQGFDYFFGFLSQHHAHNHYPDFLWRNDDRVPLPNVVTHVGQDGAGYATERRAYAGDLFADEAVKFVKRNREHPFFLYLALTVPHANNERSRELGDGQEVPDYGPYADREWPAPLKGQAAMITRMDAQVGRLLKTLAELGLEEQTVVFFSSDNGPHREGGAKYDPDFFDANGPLSGTKRSLTDGGIRVPMIVRGPGRIAAGRTSDYVGYFGDFFATAAELAGTATPDGLDSISLMPTLSADQAGTAPQLRHDYLYWEFHEGGSLQAVRVDDWKAIRAFGKPTTLYDLETDLAEEHDVATKHPEVVGRIERIMNEARTDDVHWPLRPAAKATRP